jgi:Bacteriocin-protection, YdeI or OmpD-Associated
VVHTLPADLRKALIANATALDAWKNITPLARNEFICWVEDAKQETTRERRIRRTQEELDEGQRRPCCWRGCKHRDRTGRQRPAYDHSSPLAGAHRLNGLTGALEIRTYSCSDPAGS